jgi:hypothetical protein
MRPWLGRLLLMGLAGALALGVAELGLRLFGFAPAPGSSR